MKNVQNAASIELVSVADRKELQSLGKELGLKIGRLSTEEMRSALLAHMDAPEQKEDEAPSTTPDAVTVEDKPENAPEAPKKEIVTVPLNTMKVGQIFKFPTSKSNYKCIEEDAEKGFKKIENLNGKAWWLRHEKELNRPVVEIEAEIEETVEEITEEVSGETETA